jgi:acyl-CoA synthetase (AMP-forming)/AMP-acid ligase II
MKIGPRILDVIERRGPHIFLVDALNGRKLTYNDFHRQACALAAELQRKGVRKGDRVAVMVPNCCELAVLYFACIYVGAVIVPLNPSSGKGDLQYILKSCKPSFAIGSESTAEVLKEFHPGLLRLITGQDTSTDRADFHDICIETLPLDPEFVPLESADANDLLVIMYTSGTSAKPKGLAHKAERMFRNATAFATTQGIDGNSRFYLTLSMAYMGGFYNLLLLPFLCGSSVVVDHVFDARSSLSFWEKARKNRVNTLWMAPTVLSILLRMDRGHSGEEFCRGSLRHVFVGFAPLPLKVKEEFESRYGVRLIENYGLSETLFVTARGHESSGGRGYVGAALPGIQLRIVNDQGVPVASSAEGEVEILTPDLMAGYLNAEGVLQEIDSSRWFPTGDMGRLNDCRTLAITGRKKDLIIRGGVNISPAAIEESLMQVNGVSEVAAVSIPHELYGEDVVAVIKLDHGIEIDSILEGLIAHARANLAQHQQPARYIAIDDLPRTANGKVQKARLRELVAEKLQVGLNSTLRAPAIHSAGVAH